MTRLLLILTVLFACSCSRVIIDKLQFYNPNYQLDKNLLLRTDGYYLITENLKTLYKTYSDTIGTPKTFTTVGFIQFLNDGFCFVGYWDGRYRNKVEIDSLIQINKPMGKWGIYKFENDTLWIEYHYRKIESFSKTHYHRFVEKCSINQDGLTIYNSGWADSILNCKGTFVETNLRVDTATNPINKDKGRLLEIKK